MEAYGKRVIADLKTEGLNNIGEDALKLVVKSLFKQLKVEIEANDKVWDNFLLPALPLVENTLLEVVDKLDGQVG